MSGGEPTQVAPDVERVVAQVERIMQRRRQGTETLQKSWTSGELTKADLPCMDSCSGTIGVKIEGDHVSGLCPAYMVKNVCPLVTKREREIAARMSLAGFGSGTTLLTPRLSASRSRLTSSWPT